MPTRTGLVRSVTSQSNLFSSVITRRCTSGSDLIALFTITAILTQNFTGGINRLTILPYKFLFSCFFLLNVFPCAPKAARLVV